MPTTAYRAIIDASDGSGGRLCGCGGNGWRDGIAKACSPSQFRTCRFPASGSSRESLAHGRDITMDNPSRWERMPLQESIEAFPWEHALAIPSRQPFPPHPHNLPREPSDASMIARYAVVGIVASHHYGQVGMLVTHAQVPIVSAPLAHGSQ